MSKPEGGSDPEATTVLSSGSGGKEGGECTDLVTDRYTVEGEVGRGGLGRVLRAVDKKLGRTIVIKQLLRPSPDLEERFRREALLSSRLEHPGIVTIHDLVIDGATPFYTMRLVAGRTLGQVFAGAKTLRDRLALVPHVLAVADAVAYAHDRGIIHRDIKPANVLVGEFGETVLIDWGLAKALGEAETDLATTSRPLSAPGLTQMGDVLGTPAYMAPEQAAGQAVDERTDVYAIGALLYELLTGRPPHTGGAMATSDLARLHALPPPAIRDRAADAPPDLAAIVTKAMATDPGERYPSAAALAQDLKRFTTGQIVSVHRYSLGSLLLRWVRRHRLPVAVGAAALVVIAVVSVISLRRVVTARAIAEASANDLRIAQARALLPVDPTASLAWLATVQYDEARFAAARSLALEAAALGTARDVLASGRGPMSTAAVAGDGRHAVAMAAGEVVIWDLERRRTRAIALTGRPEVLAIHGDTIATAIDDTVEVRGLDGALIGPRTRHAGPIRRVAFAPDGVRLAVLTMTGEVSVRERGGAVVPVATHEALAVSAAWSADGTQLVSTGARGTVSLWSAGAPARVIFQHAGGNTLARFAGRHVVSTGEDGSLAIHDPATSQTVSVRCPEPHQVRVLDVDPRGRWAITGGAEGGVWRWELPAGTPRRLAALPAPVRSMAISGDGQWVWLGGEDGVLRGIGSDGRSQGDVSWRGHTGHIQAIGFDGNGDLVSTGRDGTLRRWQTPTSGSVRQLDATSPIRELLFTPGGDVVVAATRTGVIRAWQVADGALRFEQRVGSQSALAVSPDGAWIAGAGDTDLVLWTARGEERRRLTGHTESIISIAFAPDSRHLVSSGDDGRARLWSVPEGRVRELAYGGVIWHGAFAPDGSGVALAGEGGEIRVWPLAGGEPRVVGRHAIGVQRLLWAPSGTLFSAGSDLVVRGWSGGATEPRFVFPLRTHPADLRLSRDGRWLALAGLEGELVLWDVQTSAPAVRLEGHVGDVYRVAWSPEGLLASVGHDGAVRLWRPDIGAVGVLRGHHGASRRVAFSPDGRLLASGGDDGTVRLWPIDDLSVPRTPEALLAWIARQTSARIDAEGRPRSPE